jgi:hypothetical protein
MSERKNMKTNIFRNCALALITFLGVINLQAAAFLRNPTPASSLFEKNVGQTAAEVEYVARMPFGMVWLSKDSATLAFRSREKSSVLEMKLNRVLSVVEGISPGPAAVRYYKGGHFQNIVPDAYEAVQFTDGTVTLRYYPKGETIEFDADFAAGTDPADLTMTFSGANALRVDSDGSLVISVPACTIRFEKPVGYQTDLNGKQVTVAVSYEIQGKGVRFKAAAYDRSRNLTIDPAISFSTYLGGLAYDAAYKIATDASGNSYIVGITQSTDFPVTNGSANHGNTTDAFVAKLDSSGSSLVWTTYIGGNNEDTAADVALDSLGNVYVVGQTASADFPATPGSFDATFNSTTCSGNPCLDGYILKFDSSGTLSYSTFLGGSDMDSATSVTVDSSGDAYVAGWTSSTDFPTTAGAFQTTHGDAGQSTVQSDAFVAKVKSTGAALLYGTFVGGIGADFANGIAVDSTGRAYITGGASLFFPTVNAIQSQNSCFDEVTNLMGNAMDAFVTRLNAAGSAPEYSTYLGGCGPTSAFDSRGADIGQDIAVDSGNNAFVVGLTDSFGSEPFPATAGAYQSSSLNSRSAFLTEMNSSGSALVYSTYFGAATFGRAIALASDGKPYITGYVDQFSMQLPVKNAVQVTFGGLRDAFVARFDPTQTGDNSLLYSSFLGGSDWEEGYGISVSGSDAYVCGFTWSGDFPATAGAFQEGFQTQPPTYSDPFDTLPAGWNLSGVWNVNSGLLIGSSNDSKSKSIATSPTIACDNCSFETRFRIRTSTGKTRLYGWKQDKKNYVRLDIDEKKDKVVLKHINSGTSVLSKSASVPILPNVDYILRLEVNGKNIKLFVDGDLKIDANSSQFPKDNGVYEFVTLRGKNGIPADYSFDYITIRDLSNPVDTTSGFVTKISD